MRNDAGSALSTLPKLDLGRRLARGIALADLHAAVTDVRECWQQDGVLHGELILDLRDWPDPLAALHIVDAAMQTTTPWSYALFAALDAPWPELPALVLEADITSLRGVLATEAADLPSVSETWRAVHAAGWLRLVHAENRQRLREALALGFDRLVGGTALLDEPDLLAHLRAHRLPVLVSPSAQIAAGDVANGPAHPIARLTDAGLTTVLGSGWPTPVAPALSTELAGLAQHHHWRLESLRALMTRNAEAAAMPATMRFAVARQIEAWRHRPPAAAPTKGDGWNA